MVCALNGQWQCDRSENFDEFLKAMAVPWPMRKMAGSVQPKLSLAFSEDGQGCHVVFEAGMIMKNEDDLSFREGDSTSLTFNGIPMNARATMNGDEMEVDMQPVDPSKKNHVPVKINRTVVNEELVQTMQTGDVTCKRIFKKMS